MSHEPAWKDQVEYRGRTYHLTTEHALSSYGIPVVVYPETREVYDFESIVRGKDGCFYGAEIYRAAGYPVPEGVAEGKLMDESKSLDTARGDMPYLIGRLQGMLEAVEDVVRKEGEYRPIRSTINIMSHHPEVRFSTLLFHGKELIKLLKEEDEDTAEEITALLDSIMRRIAAPPEPISDEERTAFATGYYYQYKETAKILADRGFRTGTELS